MIKKILKKFGYIRITDIKIPKHFKLPNKRKMEEKSWYIILYNEFEQPIVLDENDYLIDGYTTYLLAGIIGYGYVKFERFKI